MRLAGWIGWAVLALSAGCSSASGGDGVASEQACSPLETTTSKVTLDAASILAAGRSADGTVYVVTLSDSRPRLFVSGVNGDAVVERPAAGTGEVHDGATSTWLFDYTETDGSAVSVEVVQDAADVRLGVLKGPKSGKTWDLAEGEQLTLMPASEAATLPATSGQSYSVDYAGARADGNEVVVIAPDHAMSYDGFRLFWGTTSNLRERVITSFSRARSIGGTTTVAFETEAGSATLSYSFPYPLPDTGGMSEGSLALGTRTDPLTGAAPATLPDGARFSCR